MSDTNDQPSKAQNARPTVVAHMMTTGVVQVPGDVTVSEAALLLEREHAPCLLVKETDSIFGLMTPNDIVKKVVAQGLEPQEIEVRSIMTRPVPFIEYDVALEEACTMMVATGASLLIVTKENQPVGVLSAQDLMLSPPRRPTKIPTILTVLNEELTEQQAYNAVILELNHIGARVESLARLHDKSRVFLALTLPGHNSPLTVHGRVMECAPTLAESTSLRPHPFTVEIQFADLSNTDRARLKAWALQTMPSSSTHS